MMIASVLLLLLLFFGREETGQFPLGHVDVTRDHHLHAYLIILRLVHIILCMKVDHVITGPSVYQS